jgi:hypothetical protein
MHRAGFGLLYTVAVSGREPFCDAVIIRTAIETEQFDMASAIRIAWTPRMQEQALIA